MTKNPLANLLKQEFIDTRKWFLTLGGVFALVLIIGSALVAAGWPIISGLVLFITILLTVLLIPGVLVILGVNYWQSMYGARGYFTFSIPTRGRSLYFAKVLYAWIVVLIAALATAGAVALILTALALGQRIPVGEFFTQVWSIIPPLPAGWLIALIAIFVGQLLVLVVNAAAIMSIGAQSRFNSLGFGAPVIGAIIFYLVMQLIDLIAMFLVPISVSIQGPSAGKIVWRSMFTSLQDMVAGSEPTVIGLGTLLTAVIVAAGMAAWAVNAIERHTSLR